MNLLDSLLNIMLHFTPCTYLLCTALLLARKNSGDKSRSLLALSLFIWGVLMMGSVIYHYADMQTGPGEVLSIYSLFFTLFALHCMTLYSKEVIAPGKLDTKTLLNLLLGNIILIVVLLITRPHFIKLQSFNDIILHIDQYNVWLRVVISLYILAMAQFVFILPYKHTKSRVSIRWIRWFSAGLTISTTLYIVWVFTNSDITRLIMQVYCLIYCLVITYQELYWRLPSTMQKAEIRPAITPPNSCLSPIWLRTIKVMEDKREWNNPNLTLIDLAALVGTNRTTLSNLIREAGYDGFYSLINTYRIKELLHLITNNKIDSIQEAFYTVGFRSKSTAIRYFRQETGTTPSEYLQNKVIEYK